MKKSFIRNNILLQISFFSSVEDIHTRGNGFDFFDNFPACFDIFRRVFVRCIVKRNNLRSSITRAKNQLEYQSQKKADKPNPMPDVYKRQVDEVYNTTTTKINLAKVSEKFNMMGLPRLPDSSAADDDSLVGKVVSGIREFFSKENTLIFTQSKIDQKPMKQFTLLNSILAVTSLESQDGKGAYLNEAQLQAF